jgi:hypothetical protein
MQNFGWAGVDRRILDRALANAPPHLIQQINIIGGAPPLDNLMLFRVTRQALGKDTENYAQQIGDCVSFGAKNVTEYLQCCQMIMGNLSDFHPIFPPYAYGTSRSIGHMLGGQDGSVGIFAAQAANQYGELNCDAEGVPKYSGDIAKSWGRSESPWQSFVPVGKEHLVQKTAKIATWEDLIAAITNLYPVTIASDVGFTMTPQSDGYHHRQGSWGHQMAVIGIDNGDTSKSIEPHVCILNSWGDVMGSVTDFRDTNLKWPVGTLRVHKKDIMAIIQQDDTWAYSSFQDFPSQVLPAEFFNMF